MNEKNTWFVVTGASNGIGYETALQLSKQPGIQVLAIARTKEKLDSLQQEAGSSLQTMVFDLEKEDANKILKWFQERDIHELQGIINNAGFLINKPFATITKEDLEKIYRINVFAPFLLTQSVLPLLKKSSGAHVIHISSMGGFQGSSKFAGLDRKSVV